MPLDGRARHRLCEDWGLWEWNIGSGRGMEDERLSAGKADLGKGNKQIEDPRRKEKRRKAKKKREYQKGIASK